MTLKNEMGLCPILILQGFNLFHEIFVLCRKFGLKFFKVMLLRSKYFIFIFNVLFI